ncbi:MAG: hypothetical protein SGARI_007338, partial [Bacillariaceae sp.]
MGTTSSKYRHIKNDFELVIRSSKDLEHILDTQFGAHGKGLHEKISSVAGLSPDLVKNMRYLATIRNKLVHEYDFNKIPEREKFIGKFDQSTVDLKKAVEERGNGGC